MYRIPCPFGNYAGLSDKFWWDKKKKAKGDARQPIYKYRFYTSSDHGRGYFGYGLLHTVFEVVDDCHHVLRIPFHFLGMGALAFTASTSIHGLAARRHDQLYMQGLEGLLALA